VTLRGSEPVSAKGGSARHRAPHPGRLRRLYALAVVLVMTGALGWQLWGDPWSDPVTSSGGERAARSAQTSPPPAHQRTVATIVGPDTIRVVEHLSFTSPTDVVTLENPEHLGAGAGFSPVIEDLWADAGSGPRQPVSSPAAGETVSIQLTDAATEVTVGYLATGVVKRTVGSATGRALGLVTPLRLEQNTGLRAVEVRGVWVDNLGCVDGSGRMTACGRGTPLGWATSAEDMQLVDVIAQLTVPS
jgi:hypothetical protein